MRSIEEGAVRRESWTFELQMLICFASLVSSGFTASTSLQPSKSDIPSTVCQFTNFQASCGADEVIVMTSALYGYMRLNACLSSTVNVGCYADVITHMDALCSGRQDCDVSISTDETLRAVQMRRPEGGVTCIQEMYKYMEASYKCMPVAPYSQRTCESHTHSLLTAPSGYITNAHTSNVCQWKIRLLTGQRINITLYDFGLSVNSGQRLPGGGLSSCQKYAVIYEAGKDPIICSGQHRIRHVFLSDSNEVTIESLGAQTGTDSARAVLYYEAVGCGHPSIADNTWMERNGDVATVWCNSTQQASHLTCYSGAWHGHILPCPITQGTGSKSGSWWGYLTTDWTSTQGIVVIVVVGIILGVIIGGCLLTVVFVHYKRRERGRLTQMEESEYETGFHDDNHVHLGDNALDYNYRMCGADLQHHEQLQPANKHALFTWKGNKYIEDERCVCDPQLSKQTVTQAEAKSPDVPRQTPLRTPSGTGMVLFGKNPGKPGPDHVYETPK